MIQHLYLTSWGIKVEDTVEKKKLETVTQITFDSFLKPTDILV
jgi:hypothetical protein